MRSRMAMGIVGAGHAGMALGVAFLRAGWPLAAISSRDPEHRAAAGTVLPGVRAVRRPDEVAAVADLVLLAVPDDAIVSVGADLRARRGTIVAHLSGVHPAGILRPVVEPSVHIGGFHPLVAFADQAQAVEALNGAYVAIDGDLEAVETLRSVAEALGARPVVLGSGGSVDPATAKAAHHAAAVLAAGGFIALLDAIVELARVAGLDETSALETYGSLVPQGLVNAAVLGVSGALTGPVLRGDVGTLQAHLDAIAATTPDVRELYLGAARRQLAIARRSGARDATRDAALERLLGD